MWVSLPPVFLKVESAGKGRPQSLPAAPKLVTSVGGVAMELACTNRRVLALLVSLEQAKLAQWNKQRPRSAGETSPRSLVIYHEKIGIYTRDASVDLGSPADTHRWFLAADPEVASTTKAWNEGTRYPLRWSSNDRTLSTHELPRTPTPASAPAMRTPTPAPAPAPARTPSAPPLAAMARGEAGATCPPG